MMMTKTKSKKRKQLKYLVLIPALGSMLFYTSCSSTALKKEVSNYEKVLTEQKKLSKLQLAKMELQNSQLKDSIAKLNQQKEDDKKTTKYLKDKLYEQNNSSVEYKRNDTSVSFMMIEKAPTLPGCEPGDKNCFSKMVQQHFLKNFDADLPNKLGLVSGRKKVYIGFTIDAEGNVIDIKARAPHPAIKKEVIRVMETLPKMIPGKQSGENVGVKISIPFTIIVQ
jgi:cell division protein FtsB